MAASMAMLVPGQSKVYNLIRYQSARNVPSLGRTVRDPVNRVPHTRPRSAAINQALDSQDNGFAPLQRVCKSLLVGVAAAATWSVLASAVCGPSAPLASLTLAAGSSEASGAPVAARSAWAGLAAGFLHTLCGPDHLAALTPLTIGRKRAAASALGALWGFGHSTGQLILGLVFVVLKDRFHDFVPALSRWSGTVVGLTLIGIGLMGIYETYFEGQEEGEQQHGQPQLAVAGGLCTVAAASSYW
eukprot:GHRQ01033065.1.p1 GENE.GHRQ01033065.1~~GHRQ01033065.1.p1  ORF type:complete len:244 (+),score=46.23 GHRQ01033065.1:63-794(+)